MQLYQTFATETIKLHRTKIFGISIGFFIFIPLMLGLLMYIAQNPAVAAKLGLVAAKASMFGDNSWNSYLTVLNQSVAVIGLIGFGFICTWVFGREHADRTLKDMLALTVSRHSFVAAKLILISLWCVLLSLIMFLAGLAVGKLTGVTGWETGMLSEAASVFFSTALYSLLLITPVAFVAGIGRGFFVPLVFIIFTVLTAQFAAMGGAGAYYPWSVPGINTLPAETPGMSLLPVSFIILVLTSLAGYIATVLWWKKADHY